MSEEWLVIESEPFYSVSNIGRVKRNDTGRVKSLRIDRYGYERVTLYPSGKTHAIHRLVGLAFKKEQYRSHLQIDHIDGNKRNNTSDNLEWVTAKENTIRAYSNGLAKGAIGSSNGASLISDEIAYNIKYSFDICNADAAKEFNVSESIVEKIRYRQQWTHIVDNSLEDALLKGKVSYAKGKTANISEQTKEELHKLIRSKSMTPLEISERLGISKCTVYRHKKRYKI